MFITSLHYIITLHLWLMLRNLGPENLLADVKFGKRLRRKHDSLSVPSINDAVWTKLPS